MVYLVGIMYDDFGDGGFRVMAVTSKKKNLAKIKQEILEKYPKINPILIASKYFCEDKVYREEGPVPEGIE